MNYRTTLLRPITLALLLSLPAAAQYGQTVFVDVKPEMQSEWEALQKELNAAIEAKGLAPSRHIWQGARGATNRYYIGSVFNQYAEFDSDDTGAQAMGEAGFARWVARITKTTQSREVRVSQPQPELMILREDDWKPELGVFLLRQIVPGKSDEYAELIRTEFLPAYKKAGVKAYYVARGRWGFPTNTWVIGMFTSDWATLDQKSPLERALGKEGATALRRKAAALTRGGENMILRYRADLSFGKLAAPASN